jgi:hypothetical protein
MTMRTDVKFWFAHPTGVAVISSHKPAYRY